MSRTTWAKMLCGVTSLGLSACGGEPASGPSASTPASLQVVSGSGQTGLPGDTLAEPLVVRVTGSDGNPFAGATVNWVVTGGLAGFTDAQTRSGADGLSSTRVILGALTPGAAVTVSVGVEGLPPVSFTASLIDPCTYARSLVIGQTAAGSLTTPDCRLADDTPVDFHLLTVLATRGVRLTLTAAAYEPFLFALDSVGRVVAQTRSRPTSGGTSLRLILPPGRYLVGANAYAAGDYGTYTLEAAPAPDTLGACDPAWIALGLSTGDRLTTRCPPPIGPVEHRVLFGLRAGDSVTVAMAAGGFTARVRVELITGGTSSAVRSASATGPGQLAAAGYRTAQAGLFIAVLGSTTIADTGAYTYSVR